MRRTIGKLTARGAATAGPGLHSDGGCLYLRVRATGGRSWVFRWRDGGRDREVGLGPLHTLPLKVARQEAQRLRMLRLDGRDPLLDRRARKAASGSDAIPTFSHCAARFIEAHKASWSSPKHAKQWTATLDAYAAPVIGDKPVDRIDRRDVLAVLEPIWHEKPETASRVRGRVEKVLDWARAKGFRQGENPARWRGHLDAVLPPKARVRRPEHHPALDWRQLPAFMVELRQRQGVGALALEFAIVTAARSGEVRGARWSEIDGDVWVIPAGRMKARREHRVPLSAAALRVLSTMRRFGDAPDALIFPGGRGLAAGPGSVRRLRPSYDGPISQSRRPVRARLCLPERRH